MTQEALTLKPGKYRILPMLLIAVMVFAAWHVASHDISITNDVSAHEECQVCRVNHLPIADLPTLFWATPFFVLILLVVIPVFLQPKNTYRFTLGARAPPLF